MKACLSRAASVRSLGVRCSRGHVLAAERHDARRIDRQLSGRGGRQGDPGSFQAIMSLEKEIFHGIFKGYAARLCRRREPLPARPGKLLVWVARRGAERYHARTRDALLRSDDRQSDLPAFTGGSE
jgi:preprotein translocase subunit SecA